MLKSNQYFANRRAWAWAAILFLIGLGFVLRLGNYHVNKNREIETNEELIPSAPQRHLVTTNYCNVYDLRQPVKEEFQCLKTSIQPSTNICIYNVEEDKYISYKISTHGNYQGELVMQIVQLLQRFPTAGFYDIGANIGMHTLTIAQMGRTVVAVEPNLRSVERLQKAAQLSGTTKYITLVNNGISDQRGTAGISLLMKANMGGAGVFQGVECPAPCLQNITTIFLDDLLEVTTFKSAIMKIDIEGFEDKAFTHANKLFEAVDIPYVVMEWFMMKKKDKAHILKTVDWFISRGYLPYDTVDKKTKLRPHRCKSWPFDIVWIKENILGN